MKLVPDFTEILSVLTSREEQIIRMRLTRTPKGYPITFHRIGCDFAGVSEERVRSIYVRAMNKLSDPEYLKKCYENAQAVDFLYPWPRPIKRNRRGWLNYP